MLVVLAVVGWLCILMLIGMQNSSAAIDRTIEKLHDMERKL